MPRHQTEKRKRENEADVHTKKKQREEVRKERTSERRDQKRLRRRKKKKLNFVISESLVTFAGESSANRVFSHDGHSRQSGQKEEEVDRTVRVRSGHARAGENARCFCLAERRRPLGHSPFKERNENTAVSRNITTHASLAKNGWGAHLKKYLGKPLPSLCDKQNPRVSNRY